ncbi:uncharacterized protein ATNIH1004_001996 [Aspergillus tanneri]|uniref:Thioester reductase (TE) domain-containing protein n=1 Tax=Aspergillus tanneri TaxID=1220188 RepID=A0A5M9M3K7_9EURO|nr:uncharacterized protein ATNIH1004_001996 [Aspergillus tanneri]KAA8641328.1 hypothetical protein ATNIH1004_001996 [Aspergillus tanneri]
MAVPCPSYFTSGSTWGQPKGSLSALKGGFINYLAAKQKELGLDSSTVVLGTAKLPGFDMGLARTLNAIMNGGGLSLYLQEIQKGFATPSEYLVVLQHGRKYLHDYTGWRHALSQVVGLSRTSSNGSSALDWERTALWCRDSYGVTEISACTTFETMSASQLEEARSVGRTIANTLSHLASNLPLPQYMHPAAVICLNEGYPEMQNGKIDQKTDRAMPWTAQSPAGRTCKTTNLDEGELKLLWQNLLPGKANQPESDFFFLLGEILYCWSRCKGAIRTSIGVSLTLRELYGASTLALMALKVKGEKPKHLQRRSTGWRKQQYRRISSSMFSSDARSARVHCIAVEKEQEHVLPTSDKISLYYGTLLDQCSPDLGSTIALPNLPSVPDSATIYLFGAVISPVRKRHPSARLRVYAPSLPRLGPTASPQQNGQARCSSSVSPSRPVQTSVSTAPARQSAIKLLPPDALNSLTTLLCHSRYDTRLTRMEGYLDFQKVEIVAEEIATLVTSRFTRPSTPQSFTTSGCPFFPSSSKVKIPVKSFREYMEKVHGRPFQELNLRDWSSLALERGIEPLIPSFLEAVDDNQDTVRYPYLGE